ncbi:MAG: aminodeoxychorismate lyase [Thiohalocapsa sp.]|uniref:aminodeoxychorismate lyase n=1 Tax=Thiohalocapsa sp. TaxID=2497641 RepID=UPI0025E42CB9|nr:aminodeoxychorismate lyase [Thiohalocapsa sp.]MCG6943219.1 aminodeoxychorismate lyase [Thiohalocapsa sp.]
MARASALVDGRAADRVAVTDRGLHYGDGLFETIAVRGRCPCLWQRHLERLALGCERLGIPVPAPDTLVAEARQLLDGADAADGVLKLILTRGSGARGYAAPPAPRPTRILSFHPGLPEPRRGTEAIIRLTLCETPLGDNARLAGIKHLNRLEQVLARAEWSDPRILDGIMSDGRGHPVCGTMSNIYVLDAAGIATPPLTRCGVAGTVRDVVRDCATALGIPFQERQLDLSDLHAADGLMMSNALLGLMPVGWLCEHRYSAGTVPAALIDRVRATALEPETLA